MRRIIYGGITVVGIALDAIELVKAVGAVQALVSTAGIVGLVLIFVGCVLFVWDWWHHRGPSRETIPEFSRKDQAYKELAELIRLGHELWGARELIQEGADPFADAKIQGILADIQRERNLPENSRIGDSELDDKFDALVSMYMRFAEFRFPSDPQLIEDMNYLHTRIREYIHHHIKDRLK